MFVVLLLFFFLSSPSAASSATPEEEYKKLQEQMQEQKKKLSEVQEKESSVLSELDDVNVKLGKIEAELRRYRKTLKQTEAEISDVNTQITKTKNSLQRQKDWVKRKLRIMQKLGYSGDIVMMLLSADDISQMMRTWKYLEHITLYEHKILGSYNENLRTLDEKYSRLQALQEDLRKNTDKIRGKESDLAGK